jgi:hypothetical protein
MQPFVEPPGRHTGLKIAYKTPKAKIFDSMSKISLVSRQILAVVEMSNWFFGSRVTPSVDLNEILQYFASAQKDKMPTGRLEALRRLADVHIMMVDDETALRLFQTALKGGTNMGIHRLRAECMVGIGIS